MKCICPNPMPWNEAFQQLTKFANEYSCIPPLPPIPLILGGWNYSNDIEKRNRWEDTVAWATSNGCVEVVAGIPDHDFYFVSEPSTYAIGPTGGPLYRSWNFDSKSRLSSEDISFHFKLLQSRWSEIAGPELSDITYPISFTGEKARRLLAHAEHSAVPPWGGWAHLSAVETERRTFTRLRTAVNKAIAPHEIDHIDFTTDGL